MGPILFGEIELPLSIIVNIIPATGLPLAVALDRVVWDRCGITDPLRPKLFLIYMFRLFKTVTSTAIPAQTAGAVLLEEKSSVSCFFSSPLSSPFPPS